MTEQLCGWCLDPVEPGREVACPECGAAHHRSCAEAASSCSTTGCAGIVATVSRPTTQAPLPAQPVPPRPAQPVIPRPANVMAEEGLDGPERWQTPEPTAPAGRPASPGFHWGAALLGPVWGFGHSPGTGLWVAAVYAVLYGLGAFAYGWLAHLLLGVVGWEVGWRDHISAGNHPAHYHARERAWTIAAWVVVGAGAGAYLLFT